MMVENGESGGRVAAPVARQLFDAWLLSEEEGEDDVEVTAEVQP